MTLLQIKLQTTPLLHTWSFSMSLLTWGEGREITVHHQECEEPTSFTAIHSKIRQMARLYYFIKIPKIDLVKVTVKSQALMCVAK